MAGDHIVVDECLYIDVLAPLDKELNALLEDKRYELVIICEILKLVRRIIAFNFVWPKGDG